MSSIVRIKTASNIDWSACWLVSRVPQDMSKFDILSQVRDTNGNLMFAFSVQVADQSRRTGFYTLSAGADETDVRPGVYSCDIQYKHKVSGQVEYTETFLVEMVKHISYEVV